MSRRYYFFGGLVIAGLLMVASMSFGTKKASALILNPNPSPPGMPLALQWYLANCDNLAYNPGRQSPAFTQWISPAGDPTTTTITVPYGSTAPITLEYHWAAAVCFSNSSVTAAHLRVNGASSVISGVPSGTVNGIVGSVLNLDFNPNYRTVGAFRTASATFTWTPPAGLTSDVEVDITLDTSSINRFASGAVGCIIGFPTPPANEFDFGHCPNDHPAFPIFIHVDNPPPERLITSPAGNCNIIEGWTYDTSNVFSQLRVELRVDAAFKPTPDAVTIANLPNPPPPPPGYVGPLHGFRFDISSYTAGLTGTRNFYLVVRGVNSAQVPDGIDDFGSVITVGPCVEPTCATLLTAPISPEPGDNFTATIGFNWSGPSRSYSITPGALPAGISYVPPAPTTRSGNTTTRQTLTYTAVGANAGTYTLTWRAVVGSTTLNCVGDLVIAAKPYVKVYGNDVAVGGKFADNTVSTCSAGPSIPGSSIYGFTKRVGGGGGSTNYGGASSQFGAFSLGQNDQFFTAGSHNGVTAANSPLPPTGLTFGNAISNALVSDYGGSYGQSRCIPDYYGAGHNPDGTNKIGKGFFGPNNSCIGAAGCFFGLGGLLGKNIQAAFFVDGDLKIAGNVIYDGSGVGPASNGWAAPNQIQAAYIVVRGDIYIDKNVSQMDGIYIAQKKADGTGGNIYTCTNATLVPAAPSLIPINQLYDQCRTKLTVSGAFISNVVHYQRSNGTVGKSIGGSAPANEDPGSANIAEVFNFSQEMYLAPTPAVFNEAFGQTGSTGAYDSIISLPPIL